MHSPTNTQKLKHQLLVKNLTYVLDLFIDDKIQSYANIKHPPINKKQEQRSVQSSFIHSYIRSGSQLKRALWVVQSAEESIVGSTISGTYLTATVGEERERE